MTTAFITKSVVDPGGSSRNFCDVTGIENLFPMGHKIFGGMCQHISDVLFNMVVSSVLLFFSDRIEIEIYIFSITFFIFANLHS